MNTDNGALEFDAYLNNDKLIAGCQETERRIQGLSSSAVNESKKIDDAFSKVGGLMAGYFGIQALTGFGRELVNVRGEFQQLDVAFTTMLGSKEKSDKLMAQIVDTAAKTPFTLTQVASGAKQLLAYQVAAEDVNDTVIRLGNISAGVSVPLDRLILAYGQVKAKGKLQGDDMRQFTEAGIPIIHELAKVMGVADDQISKMVENGKIGFPQVQQVIQNLTNQGGMFYNLMEKQSQTLTGQISNLEDAWDRMLNKIGESNDSFLSDIITGTTGAIEHYQDILGAIEPIIAAYGAYKAALIVTAVAQKAVALSTFIQEYLTMAKALGFATANQIAFNNAALMNPYALAAAALAGLAVVAYKFATATTVAEDAQKELNASISSETMTLDILFDRLKNAKQGTEEYQKAKESIIQKYGQYDSMLNTELNTVNGMKIAYDKLTKAVVDSAKARLKDKYTKDISDNYSEKIADQWQSVQKKLTDKLGSDAGNALLSQVKAAFDKSGKYAAENILSKNGISPQAVGWFSGSVSKTFDNIDQLNSKMKNDLKDTLSIFGDAQDATSKTATGTEKVIVKNKQYWEDQKKNAQTARDAMADTEKGSESWRKQSQLIAEADAHLKSYSDKQARAGKITPFGTLEYWTEVLKKMKDSITAYDSITGKAVGSKFNSKLQPTQKGVDITADIAAAEAKIKALTYRSFDEEMSYRKQQYDEYYQYVIMFGQEAANKQFEALKSRGSSYTEFLENKQKELQSIVSKGGATSEQIENLNKLTKALNEAKGIKDPFAQFQEDLSKLKDDSKTTTEYLEKLAETRKKVNDNKNLTPEQKTQALQLIDKTSSDESRKYFNDLLNQYKTTQQQIVELQANYNNDIEELNKRLFKAKTDDEKQQIMDAIAARNDAFKKSSGQFEVDQLMKSTDWTTLFGNMDTLTINKMIELRNRLEAEWSKLNLPPDQLKALRDQMDKINDQIRTKNPFAALKDAFQSYKSATKDEDKDKAFKDIFKSAASGIDLVKGSFDAVIGGMDKMGISMSENTKAVIGDIDGIMSGASQLATGIASGNPLSIIQGSISVISSGYDLLFGSKDRKLEATIKKHQDNVKDLQATYEQLERTIDKALGSETYANQVSAIKNLKQQQQEYQAMIAAEEAKKKTDSGKIDEYKNQITDIQNKIEDTVNSIREDLIGGAVKDVADSLGDAIITAFANGEDAAQAWANKVNDVVGDVIKKMLIQKLVEEPVGNIINKYLAKWVDSDGNFLGFDSVMTQAAQMGTELTSLSSGITSVLDQMPDSIKKYLGDSNSSSSSLSGSISSTVTEETATLLAGYINAIRINQAQSIDIMRNQLLKLDEIAKNTAYNKFLENIDKTLSKLSGDSLRGLGLN
jgi:tape measure domain-containing protein